MQSDTDTALEETLVAVKSGLETACRFGLDSLFAKEVDVGLQSKAGDKDAEGRPSEKRPEARGQDKRTLAGKSPT